VVSDFEQIFDALSNARVRYLTVGGVAVVLHGSPRFTADLDLVVDLEATNIAAALDAFARLGFRPRPPVPLDDFADATKRQTWVDTKGMRVLSLWSPRFPATEVDLFVEQPFAFEQVYSRALRADLGTTTAIVVSKDDLIAMKRAAGRPKDLEDVRALTLEPPLTADSGEGQDG